MNTIIATLLIIGLTVPSGFAQNQALQKAIRAQNTAESLINRGDLSGSGNFISVHGLNPAPKQLIGNALLDENWNKSTFLLYKNQELISGYLVRYNIAENEFELMQVAAEKVYRLQASVVQNVAWIDSNTGKTRYFVNGMDYQEEGAPIAGFFEVLVDGEIPYFRRTKAILKKANYNTALMVGNPNDEIVKRDIYYYLEGNTVIEVPKTRKKILEVFPDKQSELEAFIKQNNLYFKDENDVIRLFEYYNSLFEGYQPLHSE
jgi:hypothetical protein